MGCSNSKTIDSLSSTDVGVGNLKESFIERFLNTGIIKEMSKNAFVSMLNKYPEAKKIFKVPETTKTNTELIDTKEVQVASDKLLNHYVDIVKTTDTNLDGTIRKKAEELNKLGVKAEYMKCYGENLARTSATNISDQLNTSEEKAWKAVTNDITNKLTTAMTTLPNSTSSS